MSRNRLALIAMGAVFTLAGCQTQTLQTPLWHPFKPSVPLAQAVQDAFYNSGDPVLTQLHVETQRNTVFLSGYVKKIRQSDQAEQIARQVPGVGVVENNIIIRQ